MPGRHRRSRSIPLPRAGKLTVSGAALLGVTSVVLPLMPSTAMADTSGLDAAQRAQAQPSAGSHESRGHRVVDAASEQFGRPYMYGGDGPVVFDCSGLTKYVYHEFGVQLPHNSAQQYQVVNHVAKSDMRLGDLVFIYDDDGIFHVGIYAGGNQMWAAGHTGDVVRKQEIWTDKYVVGRP